MLLTSPGVPFVYYGEEIGMIGEKPDEMIRNPMQWSSAAHGGFTQANRPWEPLQPGHATRNVAVQDADPASLLNHYRRLIRLRQSEAALSRGSFRSIETGREDVIAWERSVEGDASSSSRTCRTRRLAIFGFRAPKAHPSQPSCCMRHRSWPARPTSSRTGCMSSRYGETRMKLC